MARREYRKSERQWEKQYYEYMRQFGARLGTKTYKYQNEYVVGEMLTYEQFKIQYTIARQTNIQLTGKVGDVYKTII